MTGLRRYFRTALVTLTGVLAMGSLTAGLYAFRNALQAGGRHVSALEFLIAFFVVVGSCYCVTAKLALAEIRKVINAGGEDATSHAK